ncbi:MAG TPA: PAS domain S-box protein, partial [Deinococcales bacterium]|nr:PAS domain S-box protein [Deinococcales bacterium]
MTLAGRAIRRVVQAVAVSVVVAGAGGLVAYRSLGDYTVTNALVERTLHLIAGVESLSGHVADANINQRHYVESGGESALALRDAARREVQQDMAALRSGVRDPKAAELLSDAWKTIEANQRSDDRATAARRQGPWPAAREQAFDRQSTDEVAAIHVALQRLAARERELLAERAANQRHLGQLATFALAGSLLGALALAVAAVRLLLLEEASRLEEERRRVTAEAVVRAERDFAQQVVSTMGQGLAVLDDACRLGFVNPALASLVGRPPQELEGRALDEFFTEARWRDARRAWDEPAEPGFRRFEATLTGGDGQEIPVLVAGTPRRAGLASSRTILVVTDLSDLRRKDAALREREAGYRLLAENSTDMIVRLDAESRFIYASPAALGVLGYTPEELLGTLAIECIVEDDRAEVLASVRGAAAAGRSDVAVVVRVRRKDGRLVWLECTGRVLTDPKTGLLEVQGSARDVSDRKRAEEELATKEARFRAATEGSPDGFFIFEALRDASGRFLDFRYVEANPASLRFIGRTETVVGLKRREVSRPKEFDVFGPLFERVLFTGETLDQEVELGFPRGNPLRFVRVLAVKVGDGVAVSLRNVTERVETQRALERSERRFRAAADNSPIGLAICALDGRWLSVNPALCAITGRDRDTLLRTPYKELTHPDDQALGDAEWARLLAGESTSEELVKRYLRPDGTTVWVQLNVVLVREADGRPTYFITQVQDITARREQELALRATLEELRARENESAQLAALVKSSPDAVFSVSREATVLTWNAGATRLYGYTAEEMVGTRVSRLYANVEAAEAGRAVAREVVDGLTVHDREQTHRRADGSLFPVSLSAAPIVDASGTIVAGSLIARDVTERNRLFEEVRALACHDPLTRLPNRALLGEELDKALAQAQRFGRHVAVAFLDLDRFKDLNDTHGHAAGDTVLVEMARRLAACVRRGDTLARVSGDEFCL